MKLASYNEHRVGVVTSSGICDVTSALPGFLANIPEQRINWLIAHWTELRSAVAMQAAASRPVAVESVHLLPANPGAPHIYAAPANYRRHIGELGERAVTTGGRTAREQGFFLKAPASMLGDRGVLRLPSGSARRFDHESELAVVIGRVARNVARVDALKFVFGYACLIDGTMRIEKGSGEEERTMRKSFDTFTPLGPYLVTADEVGNPGNLRNRLWVNDELRQDANTSDMIVDVPELIELISSVLTLRPGDVIASGTPEGVGRMQAGDVVRIDIERIGTMSVSVAECEERSPRPF
jgi:2-keto-4-pentenoate hydratase/2-oxohepta-3-ene-1,7-dioic acid hydratase in catechol pathway